MSILYVFYRIFISKAKEHKKNETPFRIFTSINGGLDGTRTRDLLRDRQAF